MATALDVAAIVSSAGIFVMVLVAVWGLSEMGNAGQPIMSWFALVLLVAGTAGLIAVIRLAGGGPDQLLPAPAVLPLAVGALLVADVSVLWGNFPPAPRWKRLAQPVLTVAVCAVPAVCVFAAWTLRG